MAEVDPVTGSPKVSTEKGISPERYDRFLVQKGKADQLAGDIESGKGQLILNKIQEHLLNRVNKLIEEDGECKALKKVLIDMGITLSIGEIAVKNIMRLVVKNKQTS
jgi:hypothetical protein